MKRGLIVAGKKRDPTKTKKTPVQGCIRKGPPKNEASNSRYDDAERQRVLHHIFLFMNRTAGLVGRPHLVCENGGVPTSLSTLSWAGSDDMVGMPLLLPLLVSSPL